MPDFLEYDALGQAELVRRRAVTPAELLDAAISRCERVNPQINAVVTRLDDCARAAAADAAPPGGTTAPFAGVPFLLKDLSMSLAGVPTRSGCRYLAEFAAPRDTELVVRQKRAGLVHFGKTATSELGILPTCEAAIYGPSKNPWNVGHSTGGSSGGSAAAVAAGIVPLAHASDGGGSIRIPASSCGVFGFKPTRGRIPLGPYVGDVMHGLVMEHAVSRSVRDSAALLDATEGMDIGAPYAGPGKERPFLDETRREPGKLRIAFTAKPLSPVPIHAEAIAAVRDAAKLCESLGHHVEEASYEVAEKDFLMQAFIAVWTGGVVSALEGFAHVLKKKPTADDVEPLTWALYQLGTKQPLPMYLMAAGGLQLFARAFQRKTDAYDVWLTPSSGEPPPPLGTFTPPAGGDPMASLFRAAPFAAFTSPLNVTGQPAMSVPLYWTPDGLPLGAQFFARFGDDATLFRLAAQLEQERPWTRRTPRVWASG